MKHPIMEWKPPQSPVKEISKCSDQEESDALFFLGGGGSQGTILEHYQESVIRVNCFGVLCDKQ
jgi:hypothetical protein